MDSVSLEAFPPNNYFSPTVPVLFEGTPWSVSLSTNVGRRQSPSAVAESVARVVILVCYYTFIPYLDCVGNFNNTHTL